jgi:DNA-binding NarL/FixJ family response regulator
METRTPVMIHAADPLSAAGMKAQLAFQPPIEVLGPADNRRARVAVLVADRTDESVVKAARAIRCGGTPHVVVVAAHFDESGVLAAAAAGVSGFLRRCDATSARLVSLLREVDQAGSQLPDELVARAARGSAPMLSRPQAHASQDVAERPSGLVADAHPDVRVSDREAEILRLVADGYDTADVAERLAYSESTIKAVLAKLMTRFEARNRCQMLAMAMRQGLI